MKYTNTKVFKISIVLLALIAASLCSLYIYDETRSDHGFSHDFHGGSGMTTSPEQTDRLFSQAQQWLLARSFALVESPGERAKWRFSTVKGSLHVAPGGHSAIFLRPVEDGMAPKMDFFASGTREEVALQQVEAYGAFRDFMMEIMTEYPDNSAEQVIASLEKMIGESQKSPTFLERFTDALP